MANAQGTPRVSNRQPNDMTTIEDLESSQGSLPTICPRPRTSNRQDLSDGDFLDFDRSQIDEHRQTLDFGRYFQGKGDEVTDPSFVAVDQENGYIAESKMSTLFSVKIYDQWLACKLSWIWKIQMREMFEKEVRSLQALRKDPHWHVVLLMCYYKNPVNDQGRLVLSPLAECNLRQYLCQPPTTGRKRSVAKWIGCLAVALRHIHSHKIKHKDVKPENCLIHGGNILIADMGISNIFTQGSTSSGHSAGSDMYIAPEVDDEVKRGRRQDIWSLLCCFIVMISYIRGFTILEFRRRCPLYTFHEDYDKVVTWLKNLRTTADNTDERALLDVLLNFFKKDPKERPYAPRLVNRLHAIGDGNVYMAECCALTKPARPFSSHSPSSSSISLSTNPQTLNRRSVLHFVVSAANHVMADLVFPAVLTSLNELLQGVKDGHVRSVRSAEKSFLLHIAPRHCQTAKEYLSLCNAFIEEVVEAVERDEDFSDAFSAYGQCLYEKELGEEERLYTTAYFAILVDVVLNRCRTSRWSSHADLSPLPRR